MRLQVCVALRVWYGMLGQLGRAVKAIDSKSIGVTRVSSSLTAVDLLMLRDACFAFCVFAAFWQSEGRRVGCSAVVAVVGLAAGCGRRVRATNWSSYLEISSTARAWCVPAVSIVAGGREPWGVPECGWGCVRGVLVS